MFVPIFTMITNNVYFHIFCLNESFSYCLTALLGWMSSPQFKWRFFNYKNVLVQTQCSCRMTKTLQIHQC